MLVKNGFYCCLLMTAVVLVSLVNVSRQHGYLSDPPSRASAWLVDKDFYECCKNYDYNQMYCGGKVHQWEVNGGRCGICGDPWDGDREYEKGGDKYLGKIVKTYVRNQPMSVKVQITANHLGFIEFRVCNVDGWQTDATQECLNKTVLRVYGSNEVKYPVDADLRTAEYKLDLPANLSCRHCVLQWRYVAGNSWGHDDDKNVSCQGCGVVQEQFYGCADIAILEESEAQAAQQQQAAALSSTSGNNINKPATTAESTPSTQKSVPSSWGGSGSGSSSSSGSGGRPAPAPYTSTRQCMSKLEFGSYISLSRVVQIYCERMCQTRCEKYLSLLENTDFEFDLNARLNPDARACIETCPLICQCT